MYICFNSSNYQGTLVCIPSTCTNLHVHTSMFNFIRQFVVRPLLSVCVLILKILNVWMNVWILKILLVWILKILLCGWRRRVWKTTTKTTTTTSPSPPVRASEHALLLRGSECTVTVHVDAGAQSPHTPRESTRARGSVRSTRAPDHSTQEY